MRKNMAKDMETEIALRKLGPESETSSVTEGFGDLRAVMNLEDGTDAVKESEKPPGSWRPWNLALKTPGWWTM